MHEMTKQGLQKMSEFSRVFLKLSIPLVLLLIFPNIAIGARHAYLLVAQKEDRPGFHLYNYLKIIDIESPKMKEIEKIKVGQYPYAVKVAEGYAYVFHKSGASYSASESSVYKIKLAARKIVARIDPEELGQPLYNAQENIRYSAALQNFERATKNERILFYAEMGGGHAAKHYPSAGRYRVGKDLYLLDEQ